MHFEQLNENHVERLLAFERENKVFFDHVITARTATFFSVDGVANHINDLLTLQQQTSAYSFVLMANDAIIGRANIKNVLHNTSAEIGYRVAQQFTGRGIGSLCVQHLISVSATLNLTKLHAYVMANNPASERILVKNSFSQTLCFPKHYLHQGQLLHGFQYTRIVAGQPFSVAPNAPDLPAAGHVG